jgi:hypothetical protein
MMVAAFLVAALFVAPLTMSEAVWADSPYIGGYRDSTTVHQFHQFVGKVSFLDSVISDGNVGGVVSPSGWDASASEPTGIMYQAPVNLNDDGNVTGQPQVWTPLDDEPRWRDVLDLGNEGDDDEDIDYVYYTFAWTSASRTHVFFYYEPHFHDGMADFESATYAKLGEDDSDNFASGRQNHSINGQSVRFKYLQFGVESPGGATEDWDVKQYDMTYYTSTGAVNLSSVVARSMVYNTTDYTHGTWINWDGSTPYVVGEGDYDVNADYDLKPGSSLPKGQVIWYDDSPALPEGTQLW